MMLAQQRAGCSKPTASVISRPTPGASIKISKMLNVLASARHRHRHHGKRQQRARHPEDDADELGWGHGGVLIVSGGKAATYSASG